ncbi:Uncharacterised protein [Corynebacterium ulcerans]|nr:Uncharacterised protein [Corynebacterium ulcerans]
MGFLVLGGAWALMKHLCAGLFDIAAQGEKYVVDSNVEGNISLWFS